MKEDDSLVDAAKEVHQQYADVLRAGKIRLNGEWVIWCTNTSTELQLASFHAAFVAKLNSVTSLITDTDVTLRNVPYLFCKAVSFNYVLIEVLELLKRKTGAACTIETRSSLGDSLVEYSVDFLPENVMQVCVTFNGQGNVVCHDPENAETQVKGTLSCLKAEIPLPPKADFSPVYSLGLSLDGSPKLFRRLERRTDLVSVREALVFQSSFKSMAEGRMCATRAYNPQKQMSPKAKATQDIASKVFNATLNSISFTGINACPSPKWKSCRGRSCSSSAEARLLSAAPQQVFWPRRSNGASIRSLSRPISRAVGLVV
jgi:hypothetical protein